MGSLQFNLFIQSDRSSQIEIEFTMVSRRIIWIIDTESVKGKVVKI